MHTTAIIGCGHIHIPGFIKRLNEREDVTTKYAWDHDPDRAQLRASEAGAEVVGDISTILSDDSIQSVVVGAETNRHEDLVLAIAEAKKHLFVEKPLGMGAADSYKMATAIENAGVTFHTGHFMRGFPINLFLKEHIEKGTFGKITRYRHSNCHGGSLKGWFDTEWRWMADVEQAGVGGFGDLGAHSLDITLWLMGDVEQVTASIDVATGRYDDCDEYGEAMMKFNNGAVGTIAAGWVDVANPITHLIAGTEGHAHVHNRELYITSENLDGADGTTPWTDLPEALPHAFELFFDKVSLNQDVPLISAREAATRSAVMEAMYQASKEQTWVKPQTG